MAVEIGALRAMLSLDSAAFNKGIKRAQGSSERLAATMKKVAKVAATAFGAVTASALAGARDIDKAAKAARRLDASIGAFEALKLAADEAGVPLASLPDELQNINREIANIGVSGNAERALERLGLSVQEITGLDADEKIARIADAVKGLELSSGDATAVLRDLGVRNREMVLLLQGGGDAIREARQEILDYGLALSGPAAASIEKANDRIGRLSIVARVFGQQMALAVVPALGRLAEKMTDAVREGGALRTMINILANVGRAFANVIDLVSENLDFLIDLFKVFVGAKIVMFMTGVVSATLSMARAIKSTGLIMVAFTKITRAKITVIALLAAVIAKLTGTYDDLAGFIKKTSQGLLDALPPEMQERIENLGDAIGGLGENLDTLDEDVLGPRLANALEASSIAANSFGEATRGASKGVEGVSDKSKDAERNVISLQSTMENVGQTIESSMGSAFMSMVEGTKSAKDAFRDMARSIISQLFEMFVVKQITGFIGNAIGGMFGPGMTTGTPLQVPSGDGSSLLPPIFAGGGYTGNGARAGGLDGKGGFMAMMHPRETVVDHTKGQSAGGVVVNQTINVSTGVQQTVRTEIKSLMPQIAESAKSAVVDAKRRGGSYGRAFA